MQQRVYAVQACFFLSGPVKPGDRPTHTIPITLARPGIMLSSARTSPAAGSHLAPPLVRHPTHAPLMAHDACTRASSLVPTY